MPTPALLHALASSARWRKRALDCVFALALLAAGAAWAHEPREGTAVVRLQHGRLELTVILSPQMGAVLAGAAGPEAEPVHAGSFAAFQPRLVALAPALFAVQAGDATLAAERTAVTLNKMGEPEFALTYPVPQAWPLRLRGLFLSRLPVGYSGSIQVFDEGGKLLGFRALTRTGDGAELVIAAPATPAAPVNPPVPAAPPPAFSQDAPASPAPAPQPAAPSFPWTPALALLAALSIGALLRHRRTVAAQTVAKSQSSAR